MQTNEIREKYLKFFEGKKHAVVPSAPLVPENDPSTLFTGSGMQPIVPYLLGEPHPLGTRITDSQKCFRSQDIEEVGDNRHTTFFEMLGNWSFGDYFKQEQIDWMWTFLTTELGLDPKRLYFTCFRGNDELCIPRDTESAERWQTLFRATGIEAGIGEDPERDGMKPGERIFYYPEKKNWWSRAGVPANMPVGEPGGPDTEMFWDFDPTNAKGMHEASIWKDEPCHVNCDCGRFMEIGNNVFMEYKKTENGFEKLAQQNVDFGGGLERMAAALADDPDVFRLDLFHEAKTTLEKLSGNSYGESAETTHAFRVILDHIRAAVFLISDGVLPSNKDQGYFVRRLIRRAVRYGKKIGISNLFTTSIATLFIQTYTFQYSNLTEKQSLIISALDEEERKFHHALASGLKKFEEIKNDLQKIHFLNSEPFVQNLNLAQFFNAAKVHLDFGPFQNLYDFANKIHGNPIATLEEKAMRSLPQDTEETRNFIKSECERILKSIRLKGRTVFDLYQNYGFPIEMIEEESFKEGWTLNKEGFQEEFKKHQDLSRTASAGKFKGGLADHSAKVTAYHTATHLMLAGLRKELGPDVHQAGSNITEERTRFDFTYPEKVSREALDRVEAYVNEAIGASATVTTTIMDKEAAKTSGVEGSFWEKYPEKVTVYQVKGRDGTLYSQELCGGPHVGTTADIAAFGHFRIIKEEASSAGVRRVKAILT